RGCPRSPRTGRQATAAAWKSTGPPSGKASTLALSFRPLLEDGRAAAAQDDVPLVTEGPLRLSQLAVESGQQPLPGLLVGHRVEDRVEGEQRVARELHLGDQPLGKGPAEQREVDVGRPPGIVVVAPR